MTALTRMYDITMKEKLTETFTKIEVFRFVALPWAYMQKNESANSAITKTSVKCISFYFP